MNREISVIIPTLNRPDSLLRTFEFMEKSSILPDEVIVIDQTQDKDVAGRIRNICDSSKLNIKYTWISTPSTTITRNIGFSLANGEILVYMDDDVDVKQDTFSNVREIFSDENFVVLIRPDYPKIAIKTATFDPKTIFDTEISAEMLKNFKE